MGFSGEGQHVEPDFGGDGRHEQPGRRNRCGDGRHKRARLTRRRPRAAR